MKKIVCISGALLLAASACVFVCANKQNNDIDLFKANVEALSDTESGLWGTCTSNVNLCQGACPNCGKLIYAPRHTGRVKKLWGTCNNCHEEINVSY